MTLTIPSLIEQAGALIERETAFRAGLAERLARYRVIEPFENWMNAVPLTRRVPRGMN